MGVRVIFTTFNTSASGLSLLSLMHTTQHSYTFSLFSNQTKKEDILLLSSEIEFKKMKPNTGLELILNYSSQYDKKNLTNESSAGANATASRVVSVTDPLSEIVWSPDKGFSLKCVDSSFTNKNASLVEPTSMVLALLQTVTCGNSTTVKPIDDVFVQPLTVICAEEKSLVSSTDTHVRNSTSETDKISEIMENENKSSAISGNLLVQKDESKPSMAPNPSHMDIDVGINKVVEIEDGTCTRAAHMIEDKSSDALGSYSISSDINHSEKMKPTFNFEAATSAAKNRSLVSKSNKNKNKSKVMNSPFTFMARNESDQKFVSNDEDLRCESYHSTKLFLASTSRKRNKQEVIIRSKKVKMKIQETSSYSKSYVKKDDNSSFMNLVSNMMKLKEYSQIQSNQDEDKSVECLKNSTLKNENYSMEVSKRGFDLNNYEAEETREQSFDNQLCYETKKLQNCCINKEDSSVGVKDEKVKNDQISKHNEVNYVTPFPRLRDLKPIVSMFATRLGAIKKWKQTE